MSPTNRLPVLDTAPGNLFEPLSFKRGPVLSNRFALAPLTNCQSHDDGTLSNDEYRWLTMRAQGGFGLCLTCAAYVQQIGKGYRGQLGASSDSHIDGLKRLASGIKSRGSVACLQLAHSGSRALEETARVAPSAVAQSSVKVLSDTEINVIIRDFISAASRGQKARFDGVEIHAAHGFLPAQFLSPELNTREDQWGGVLENRKRFLFEILAGIRSECGPDFQLGLRLSPERFGLRLAEILDVAQEAIWSGHIDWLDMSLWDYNKDPEEEAFRGKSLLSWFSELERGEVRLGVAGKIMSANDVIECLAGGADFVLIGRGAILAHDFPLKICATPTYGSPNLPVSSAYLRNEGLGDAFVDYMRGFAGFVNNDCAASSSRDVQ